MLDRLLATGILEADESGEAYAVSPSFLETVEAARAGLDDEGTLVGALRDVVGDEETARTVADLGEPAGRFAATYLALDDALDAGAAERLQVATVLEAFAYDPPDHDGSPEPFLAVSPEQLRLLLKLHRRAVVYVWREDCPPCEEMREALETVFADPPDGVSLFSVYGPEDPVLLEEAYDVVGGPTTLFVLDDAVDCRLHGAHYPEPIETQTEVLLDL